ALAAPVGQGVAHGLLVRLADAARQRPALPREARALVEPRAVAGDVVLGSADLAGRVADGDGARGDVARDDAPGTDDRVVADRGVRQDGAARTDEHAAADDDAADARPSEMALCARVVGEDLHPGRER